MHRQRVEVRRVLVEEVAATTVQAEHVADLVRELEIDALVAQVDPVGARPEQELVPEVTALVEHAEERREVLVPVRERNSDEVVGVDQVERAGVNVEDREHTGMEAELPPATTDPVPVEREGFAEVDRRDIGELPVVEIVLPRGREVRPARVGHQGLEEHAAR